MIEHEKAQGATTYFIGFCGVCFKYIELGTEILNFIAAALGVILIIVRAYYDVPRILKLIINKGKKKNASKGNPRK